MGRGAEVQSILEGVEQGGADGEGEEDEAVLEGAEAVSRGEILGDRAEEQEYNIIPHVNDT